MVKPAEIPSVGRGDEFSYAVRTRPCRAGVMNTQIQHKQRFNTSSYNYLYTNVSTRKMSFFTFLNTEKQKSTTINCSSV